MIDTNSDARFMANNFLETGINSLTVSSTATGYSKDDLTTHERARVFKFGGRFLITLNSNDVIRVNGVSYQVAAGEYVSPSLLCTAINAAIAATGVTIFPPNAESSYSFYFQKASTYTLNASFTTNTIWDTIGVATGADQIPVLTGGLYEYTSDAPRFHWPSEYIRGDIGYQAAIGFVGIVGDLSKEIRIPEGAIVTFKANTINDFTAPLVNVTMPWSKRGLFAFLDDQIDTNFRYFELTIVAVDGPFYPEIGYFYVGDYTTFTDRNISIGVEMGTIDTSVTSSSDDGQIFTNQKAQRRVFSGVSVGLALPENVQYLKRLFTMKGITSPFFVSLDPLVKISTELDDQTMLCYFGREIQNKHLLYKFYEIGFELVEAL